MAQAEATLCGSQVDTDNRSFDAKEGEPASAPDIADDPMISARHGGTSKSLIR